MNWTPTTTRDSALFEQIVLLATWSPALALAPEKRLQFGFLSPITERMTQLATLGQNLNDLGFLEGCNLLIAYRSADRRLARLPAMFGTAEYVRMGGLVSYATNRGAMSRRAAAYVDKILKGAKPAELSVERPTRFEFVINLKTAKALGITFPPSILLRATEVIE